jgi:hypothetical protein
MTEEERQQMLRNRSQMIGAAQGPLTLGGGVPAFPENLQNINPPAAAPLIPFRGGGTAEMSVGGAQVNYPSRLGLAGGDYGTRFQFGAQEFGGARLPQSSASLNATGLDFNRPISFMDARANFNQKFPNNPASPMEATIAGFTPAGMQPQQTSIPIGGGPVSMGFASTGPTQEQQGKTEIKTPRGSMWATPEQAAAMATPRTAGQQSSRSPAEQQALLDNIRKNAPALNQQRTDWVQNTIQQRKENPVTYGGGITVPTNRFGEPIKAWTDMLGKQGRLDRTSATPPTAPSSASTDSMLASTGFGAMQRAQQASTPQSLGRSPLFAGMGYMSTFGGGPQPAQPMMAYNDQEDTRTRFRRTLGLV